MNRTIPSLIGVIHLPPLPESPRYGGDLAAVVASAASDAKVLAEAGFDGVMVENFGDAPFVPGRVSPVTVAAMTACAIAVRAAAPGLALGINVLRNDAEAALSIAVAAAADLVRVNVHTGSRVTDQGLIEGRAHETLRLRRALGAERIALLCDVDVKHSAPLAARPIGEEAHDLAERGLADGVLVTGSGTGRGAARHDLEAVLGAVRVPVLVASGVTETTLAEVRAAHGAIVGSCLRASGRAGDPIDGAIARRFAEAFRASRATDG
ncbi:photosystem I biogenesis protein BtpA [Minicystis rosea]|nr:photosystem I biogenesis protein BtpA [Minicystis rosea]